MKRRYRRKRTVKKRYKRRIRKAARNAPLVKKIPMFRHKCTSFIQVIASDAATTIADFNFARF